MEGSPISANIFSRDALRFGEQSTLTLSVDIINDNGNRVTIRGFTKDAPFVLRAIPSGSGAVETFSFNIPDIPIMLSAEYQTDEGGVSPSFVAIYLAVNGDRVSLLCQGTVSNLWGMSWPTQQPRGGVDEGGVITLATGTNPAAGADMNQATPTNETWEILGIYFQFVTDANAANRTVRLQLGMNDVAYTVAAAGTVQAASKTVNYHFIAGGTTQVVTADNQQEIALPRGILLNPGSTIKTLILNIQATDNIGLPYFYVKKYYSSF